MFLNLVILILESHITKIRENNIFEGMTCLSIVSKQFYIHLNFQTFLLIKYKTDVMSNPQ